MEQQNVEGEKDTRRGSNTSSKAVAFKIEDENTKDCTRSLSHSQNVLKYSEDLKLELYKLATFNNLFLIIIYVLLFIDNFSTALQFAIKPKLSQNVRCYVRELEETTWTFNQKKDISSPKKKSLGQGCFYYALDYKMLTSLAYDDALEEAQDEITNSNPKILQCTKYIFKNNVSIQFSLVKEFNLSCTRSLFYFSFFTQAGGAVSAFPLGIVSDIYGRKPAFYIGSLLTVIGGCISPLAPNLPLFITAQMILGAGVETLQLSLFIIFTELYRSKYRSSLTMLSFIALHLGNIIQHTILFPSIKSWRLYEVATECPFLIVLFGTILIPESPRWLINQKQWNKAWDVLRVMGSTDSHVSVEDQSISSRTISKQLRIFVKVYFQYRTCISIIICGIGSLTLYVVMTVSKQELLNHTDFVVPISCMKIIFLLLISRAAQSCNKRSICSSLFLLLATCFIASILIESPISMNITLLLLQIFSAAVYGVAVIYVLEIFPTTHRATAFGLNLTIGQVMRLAYLYYQYEVTYKLNIQVLKGFFCSFCLICAVIMVVAPNTYQDIPDTKEDLIKDLTLAEQIAFSY